MNLYTVYIYIYIYISLYIHMIYTMLLCCTSSLWRGPNKKSLHPAPIHRRILAKQPSISKRIVKGSSQHVQCLNLVAPPKEVVDLSLCGVFRGVGTRVNIRTSSLKLKGSFKKKNWLVVSTPPKKNVSWDHYSQYMEKQQMFQTTNQKKNGFYKLTYVHLSRIAFLC